MTPRLWKALLNPGENLRTGQETGRIVLRTLRRSERHLCALSTWKSAAFMGLIACSSSEKTRKTFTGGQLSQLTRLKAFLGWGKWKSVTPPHQ